MNLTPAQNTDLEMCVLGAVMLEPKQAYPITADILKQDDFYLDGHGLIFYIMGELFNRGTPPDSIAVITELRSRSLLDKVGGTGVVMGMLNSIPTAANVEHHAKIVADLSMQRRFVTGLLTLIETAGRRENTAAELLDMADGIFTNLTIGRSFQDTMEPVADVLHGVLSEASERMNEVAELVAAGKDASQCLPGAATGLPTLDRWTNGMQPGELWTIAALSSVGKSALALNILEQASAQGTPVGLVSIEMTKKSLGYRLLGGYTHRLTGGAEVVSATRLKAANDLTQHDWDLTVNAYERLLDRRFYIAQPNAGSLSAIRREIRSMVREGCRVVAIDYLQLMDTGERRVDSRHLEISKITRTLANMAKEHGITVLLLSQFNRRDSQKGFPEPRLDWLAESSSIGNDSDVVLFIHRKAPSWDDVCDKMGNFAPPEAKIIVAKNRNNRTGRFPVMFHTEALRFLQIEDVIRK